MEYLAWNFAVGTYQPTFLVFLTKVGSQKDVCMLINSPLLQVSSFLSFMLHYPVHMYYTVRE
jgi:hypothetical protein